MKDIHKILQHHWGYQNFRPLQEEIIKSVLSHTDTLALLPTGGGKSICFQVPALVQEGICIVVSPLIALMKDQVRQLEKKGITSHAIYSGLSTREIDILLDNCIYGNTKLLYVSPERLKTELFVERAKQMQINLLAVDEAHCISQWGYDFRPPYLEIKKFRDRLPHMPCIALTATATPRVRNDIIEKLGFQNEKVFADSFARKNLSYAIRATQDKETKLLEILRKVPGSAIIYVNTRKKSQQLSEWLLRHELSVDCYHAGLNNTLRDKKQKDWAMGKTQVIVATNAFGMGIDKADVRLVVHADLPDSPEAYYQESGRAGRDRLPAYAVILYYPTDADQMLEKIEKSHPNAATIKRVYQCLANAFSLAVGGGKMVSFDFDFESFIQTYHLDHMTTFHSLKRLEEQGFILFNQAYYRPSRIYMGVSREDLYKFQLANAKMDILIKSIVRMYGGELFSNFVQISEKNIAKNMCTDVQQIVAHLQFLEQSNIIIYSMQKDSPQITFLQERVATSSLNINAQALRQRKMQALEKCRAMLHYATYKRRCRMLMLLEYFGEISDTCCGICDYCIERKKAKENPEDYYNSILKILAQRPYTIQALKELIQPRHAESFIANIRHLLDFGELKYDDLNRLTVDTSKVKNR